MPRPRKLTASQLAAIDAWYAQPGRVKSPPCKVIAYRLGVSDRTIWNAALRKDTYAAFALTLALSGCAAIPNTIRPEFVHESHASQHFGEEAHWGSEILDVRAHWDLGRAYFELAEGIDVDQRRYLGAQRIYGETVGGREEFTATIGYTFTLKR